MACGSHWIIDIAIEKYQFIIKYHNIFTMNSKYQKIPKQFLKRGRNLVHITKLNHSLEHNSPSYR